MPGSPPPKPVADVSRAPWHVFMAPVHPAFMAPSARKHMAAMAVFAGALADIVALNEPAEERVKRVELLELALAGAFGPAMSRPELLPAVMLRDSLLETGGGFADALALADAVRDEISGAVEKMAVDGEVLLDHAARASAPVLRYLAHLHGETDEAVLQHADDLARAWFLLRNATRWPELAGVAVPELLGNAAGLHRHVANRYLKAQVYRLHALAEATRSARQRGHDGGDPLSGISAFRRARVAIGARMRLGFG